MGLAASRQEAFWEACGFGHAQRVKKFLESGDIDVNWVSYTHDCCPIHVASQGKTEIVKLLIEAKCNVNVQDIRGNTPVHHAAMKGHADIIKILTEAGAEVNTQDKNEWTPLHCASYWNHSETVRLLLKLGADVNLKNKDKRTALHETARSQDKDDFSLGEITQMLTEAGADLNCKGCSDLGDLEADFTGLMYAAYHNHPDVASALIDAGCDINAHGSNLWTALHWAADRGNEEMVYLLLGAGADPTRKGQRGELASDRAEKPELKEMLINAVNMFREMDILNTDSSTKETPSLTIKEEKLNSSDKTDLTLQTETTESPEKQSDKISAEMYCNDNSNSETKTKEKIVENQDEEEVLKHLTDNQDGGVQTEENTELGEAQEQLNTLEIKDQNVISTEGNGNKSKDNITCLEKENISEEINSEISVNDNEDSSVSAS